MLVNIICDGLQWKNERDGLLESKNSKNNERYVSICVSWQSVKYWYRDPFSKRDWFDSPVTDLESIVAVK